MDYVVFPYVTAKLQTFPKDYRPAELTKEGISQAELLMLEQIEIYSQKRTEDYHLMTAKYPDYNFQLETSIIEHPFEYALQYFTATNAEGQKIAFINAFCSLQGRDY